MKKLFFIIIIFSCTIGASYSQSTYKEEVDAVQGIFGVEKKKLISDLLKLNPDQDKKFWPVYDDYEVSRKELGKKRIKMLENLSDAYVEMTPAKADQVSKQTLQLATETDKMLEKYYNKVREAVDAETAFKFLQAEIYILTQIRSKLVEQIPLYGNINKVK